MSLAWKFTLELWLHNKIVLFYLDFSEKVKKKSLFRDDCGLACMEEATFTSLNPVYI